MWKEEHRHAAQIIMYDLHIIPKSRIQNNVRAAWSFKKYVPACFNPSILRIYLPDLPEGRKSITEEYLEKINEVVDRSKSEGSVQVQVQDPRRSRPRWVIENRGVFKPVLADKYTIESFADYFVDYEIEK